MTDQESSQRGVTVRSILLGAVLCVLINVGEPFLVGHVHASPLSADYSTGAAIFLLFLLSLGLNLPLRRWLPRWALSPQELLVCTLMMIIACAIPSWGFTMLLIPWIVAPTYYATPDNRWEELILPRLSPDYFVLDPEAARKFFEGLKEGETIPWGVWTGPLLRWGSFILAFYIASVCLMVLLRRPWVRHERLSYPLMRMPLAMIPTLHEGRIPAYRRWTFWLGIAVPAIAYSLKGIHAYYPDVPEIPNGTWLNIPQIKSWLSLFFFYEVIGLAFLLSSDVALGLWLFALLVFLEQGIFYATGYSIGPRQPYSDPGEQPIANQAAGAMFVLVAIGFWRAREHLWGALQAARQREAAAGENEEICPYSLAFLGFLLAGAYVLWWWFHTGLGLHAAVLAFWVGVLLIGLTRAVAQGGMAYARTPVAPAVVTLHTLGSDRLGPEGVLALAMTAPYAMDTRTTVMASTAHALRLAEEIPGRRRRLAGAILLTLVVSLAAAFLTVLYLPYRYGCVNLGGWGFSRGYHPFLYNWAREQMVHVMPVGWDQFFFMGIGGAVAALLVGLQSLFAWWPIHPLGMTLGFTHPVFHTWFSVFLAWLAKTVVLWAGGSPFYLKVRPFFIGLAVGGFVTSGFWALIHWAVGHGAVAFTLT